MILLKLIFEMLLDQILVYHILGVPNVAEFFDKFGIWTRESNFENLRIWEIESLETQSDSSNWQQVEAGNFYIFLENDVTEENVDTFEKE